LGTGVLNMVATARDAAGNEGTGTATSFYRDPEVDYESGEGLPIASIPTLGENGTVYGMVQIVGTAIGGTAAATGFKEYRLSYARLDQLQFTEFVHSTTPVTDGLLGVWDTTLLENDSYVLRLEVVSEAGNTSVHETTVGVSGNLKLGNFRLSFEDLTIPVAGIPITIVRTYDTLRADRDGDFGYGWRLEYRNTDLRVSLPKSGLEDLGIFTPFRSGTKIYMTLPGGQRVGWTFTPEMRVLPGWAKGNDLVMASPRYTPDRGNTATLTAGSGWLTVNQFGELYATGGMPWNPASPDFGGGFTVTLGDGTRYFIDGTSGLMQTASDRNGNTLTFSDSGITNSLGDVGINIVRDRHGRISSITDPIGNAIRYVYSSAGDLTNITDREGHTVRLDYHPDRAHYLATIHDPRNQGFIRQEYDDLGRITQTVDSAGGAVTFDFNIDQSVVRTSDGLGNTTISVHDNRGNIITSIDPMGAITRRTFDDNNMVQSLMDPLGNQTQFEYDNRSRLVQQTDAMGHTRRIVYQGDQVVAVVTESGATTRFTYDTRGNVTSVEDAMGAVTRIENDSRGNPTRIFDAVGNVTARTFDTHGNVLETVDAVGNQRRNSYDWNGNLTGDHAIRLVDDMPSEVSVTHRLNANGEVIATRDAYGQESQFELDALGQMVRIHEATGRSVSFAYASSSPTPTDVIFADGTRHQAVFDLAGRLTDSIDRSGRRESAEYDAAGRPVKRIQFEVKDDGSTNELITRYEYDLNGKLTATIDPLGSRTEYQYDALGRLISTKDSLGNVATRDYDPEGRITRIVDDAGHEYLFRYDVLGRQVESVLPNGGRLQFEYDTVGNRIRETDSLGNSSLFSYNAIRQLIAVVDALGNRTEYDYDEFGNIVRIRDARLGVRTFQYDSHQRLTSMWIGEDLVISRQYSAIGQLEMAMLSTGETVRYQYNQDGQLSSMSLSDGDDWEFEYSAAGERTSETSASGRRKFKYDRLGRLTERIEPDGKTVRYAYDAAGRVISTQVNDQETRFSYDSAGRLSTSLTNGKSTQYVYDPVGNLIETRFPNGILESRTFNSLNLQESLVLTDNNSNILYSELNSFDLAGNLLQQVYGDGKATVFDYDKLGQLVREDHLNNQFVVRSIRYDYDAYGNRIFKDDSSQGVTQYVYDSNSRLIETIGPAQERVVFDYTPMGQLKRRDDSTGKTWDYRWNPLGWLSAVTITTSDQVQEHHFGYDYYGNRVSSTSDGVETRFLIDVSGKTPEVIAHYRPDESSDVIYQRQQRLNGMSRDGSDYYFHTSRMGSVVAVSGSEASLVNNYRYDAFGNLLESQQTVENSLLYAGEFRDAAIGLDYLGLRYLDTDLGRFISPDPVAGLPTAPTSNNPYLYALNNPLLLNDPSGAIGSLPELSVAQSIQAMTMMALFTGVQQYAARSAKSVAWSGVSVAFNVGSAMGRFGYGMVVSVLGSERFVSGISSGVPKHHLAPTLTFTLGASFSIQQAQDATDGFLSKKLGIPVNLKSGVGGVTLRAPNSGMFKDILGNAFIGGYLLVGIQAVGGVGAAYAPVLFMGYAHGNASGLAVATTGDVGASVVTGITLPTLTIAVDGELPNLAKNTLNFAGLEFLLGGFPSF
jgi:large repetitive protein